MWTAPIALTLSFALGVHLMMDAATGVPAAAASGSQMDPLSSLLGACFSMTRSLMRAHLIGGVLSHVLCSFST